MLRLFFVAICIVSWFVQSTALTTSDFCRFEESIKDKFRNLECGADLDECATKTRKMAQENFSGSWGAVIVTNKNLVLEERVDWHVHAVNPHPSRCRLLINESVIVEVFRTGFRKLDVRQDQRQWVWQEAKGSRVPDLNICPHSSLREVMAAYSLKHLGSSDLQTNPRHNTRSQIHVTAKDIAQLFYAETGHNWNVFVTKNANQNELGLNLPHYVFDARAGFCIGQTLDGYSVNAAIVGFADEREEVTSNG